MTELIEDYMGPQGERLNSDRTSKDFPRLSEI